MDHLVAGHQAIRLGQLHDLFDISGKDQFVTAHNELILIYRHCHSVEMVHLDQSASVYVDQPGITQCLADIFAGRRHHHLHCIIRRVFLRIINPLTVRQKTAHGDNGQHTYRQTEKTRNSCC